MNANRIIVIIGILAIICIIVVGIVGFNSGINAGLNRVMSSDQWWITEVYDDDGTLAGSTYVSFLIGDEWFTHNVYIG